MKTQEIIISKGNIHDPVMEEIMQKRDAEIKELARKNARHFAKRNLPSAEGDDLLAYTGEIRTGYEKLATDVYFRLQPAAHFPEAKIDAEYFREKDKELELAIKEREDENRNAEYELSGHAQNSIPARIRLGIIATLIIFIGEVLFTTKSFQVTGESLLFALILSFSTSFAVFVFSHVAPILYKKANTQLRRIGVVISSLILVIIMFITMAIFRSSYLAVHMVYLNPAYFVTINLFFFSVSALISYFVMPGFEEIKHHMIRHKTFKAINRRKREIILLQKERAKIKETVLERTKLRMRIAHHTNYAADRIRKMYWESLEMFKTTNLTYRTDSKTPECFREVIQEPNINEFNYTLLGNNSLEQ